MNILILGAGSYGLALGKVLAQNSHRLSYYDPQKYPNRALDFTDVDLMLLAAPSSALSTLLPQLPSSLPLLSVTKGLLSLDPFKGFQSFNLLAGAAFASDLNLSRPVTLTLTDSNLAKLFTKTPFLSFDFTADRLGVLLCSSLKNLYALGAGLRNLQEGTTELQTYLQLSGQEIIAILESNHCDPATFELSCGKADLFLTASPRSRNFRLGQHLARHSTLQEDLRNTTLESLSTLSVLKNTPCPISLPANLPLLQQIINQGTAYAAQ